MGISFTGAALGGLKLGYVREAALYNNNGYWTYKSDIQGGGKRRTRKNRK
jgi:hypothetical protein